MRGTRLSIFSALALALICGCASPREPVTGPDATGVPALTEAQMQQINELTRTKGTYFPEEGVYKVTFPRTEVPVTVDGRPFHPFQGMTSWAAFSPVAEGEVMVMGDLTVFEDEVSPAMSAALDNGLEVTALHNHFLHDKPRLMFMHIGGRGPIDRLAGAVRKALDAIAAVRQDSPNPSDVFSGTPVSGENAITPEALDAILGAKGSVNNGMYKVTIGRKGRMHGVEFGTQMGLNTWAAFAGEDDGAVVDGDFAMLESEVQPVLKALRAAGIHVVAIHNHMIHDQPRYIFLHYWGKGPAQELARGLHSALDVLGD
jgi:hypothetical protein